MAENSPFENNKIDSHLNNVKKAKDDPQTTLIKSITNASKRLRILEDRYGTIRKKTQLTDQNMLEANNTFNSEIHSINSEIDKLKILMKQMNEKLDQLIIETKTLANRQELITLNKYVDYWKPMTFITKEELDRAFKRLEEDNTY